VQFAALLDEFCAAVKAGDGERFARLFTADAVYHDVFYGPHAGREAIARMLEGRFHRDGRNYEWQMIDPVADGRVGYARWLFSFDGATSHTAGKRILMEGVGLFELRDGLIARYEDFAKNGEVLLRMGFPPDKLYQVLARNVEQQEARAEVRAHLDR
jgi:ketosteroid isomerase-like protein